MSADNVAVCIEKIAVRVILACVLLYKVGNDPISTLFIAYGFFPAEKVSYVPSTALL